MKYRIEKTGIILDFIPDENVLNGLAIQSKKLETDTNFGFATCDIHKHQKVYVLPEKVTPSDVERVWLLLTPSK